MSVDLVLVDGFPLVMWAVTKKETYRLEWRGLLVLIAFQVALEFIPDL